MKILKDNNQFVFVHVCLRRRKQRIGTSTPGWRFYLLMASLLMQRDDFRIIVFWLEILITDHMLITLKYNKIKKIELCLQKDQNYRNGMKSLFSLSKLLYDVLPTFIMHKNSRNEQAFKQWETLVVQVCSPSSVIKNHDKVCI